MRVSGRVRVGLGVSSLLGFRVGSKDAQHPGVRVSCVMNVCKVGLGLTSGLVCWCG